MQRGLAVVLTVLMVAGCYNTPPRGGRIPYPPGPVDTLNILLRNDYSRLCPEHYDYCRAGRRSICCPTGACCDDGSGPYCCDHGDGERDDGYQPHGEDARSAPSGRGPCGERATTCSRAGVTICCAEDEGCCSDDQGLYCCRPQRGGY